MDSSTPASSSRPSSLPPSRSPLYFTPTPTTPSSSSSSKRNGSSKNKNSNHRHVDPVVHVHFTKCRPTSRHKHNISDTTHSTRTSTTSPFNPKTILHSILRKSPKECPPPTHAASNDYLKLAEVLSVKLVRANRCRDQALLEASRLRHSVSELQRNLDRLQSSSSSHCLKLNTSASFPTFATFSTAVVHARAAVKSLARALSLHDVSLSRATQCCTTKLVYMEASLNRVFYEIFEKSSREDCRILDPAVRCRTNRKHYEAVRGVGWEDVLSRGTKYYSQGLSRFCDERMSEIVGMMGTARRPWEEGLLEAFFGAAKGVWVVYLLARCVHPVVPVMRVERGVGFDGRFMEEEAVEMRGGVTCPVSSTTGVVRMMVAPGFYFYVGGDVVKCKVVCGGESAV